jgi:hypothetical protein
MMEAVSASETVNFVTIRKYIPEDTVNFGRICILFSTVFLSAQPKEDEVNSLPCVTWNLIYTRQ